MKKAGSSLIEAATPTPIPFQRLPSGSQQSTSTSNIKTRFTCPNKSVEDTGSSQIAARQAAAVIPTRNRLRAMPIQPTHSQIDSSRQTIETVVQSTPITDVERGASGTNANAAKGVYVNPARCRLLYRSWPLSTAWAPSL